MSKKLLKVAFLIPAHNEAPVIAETINSLLKFTQKEDIYVVNDGSKDETEAIAKNLIDNILTLNPNQGKANAINTAIEKFDLVKKYQYIMPVDADTKVSPNFLDITLPILEKDKDKKIICVVGKVIGNPHNLLTSFRLWEYEIAQTIHKAAQHFEKAIIVCPGCSTIYRSSLFKKVAVPTGTITEDMDLTFLIHRQNLGQIYFTNKAVVITQDPKKISDYLKQIDRWYTGFWQVCLKHNIPWGGQMLDAEVALLCLEGLFNSLLVLSLFILIPYVLLRNPAILLVPFSIDLLFFVLPTLILTSIKHKAWSIFKYLPFFYFLRILCSLVFLKSFIKVVLGVDLNMKWNKAIRYTLKNYG